ncbi:MAG: NADH-quinone oxidoreductase subunit N [Prevotellaceae bacterium]|jgi:NADH-quinone oxidoreductase subunit N|nr:NADH-quinone oxidoreductase subunit N [Prevotellaceae bacterium]
MNYLDNILAMRAELLVVAQIIFLIIYDLFAPKTAGKTIDFVSCALFLVITAVGFIPQADVEAFGGMYLSSPITEIMKSALNIGVILMFLQSKMWLNSEQIAHKRAEVYILVLSTLLGMYLMISSGHFLIFYIGLEMASLPLAALIAYNKYSYNSVEAGVKYILMAAFSSGLLLFGISLLYGSSGGAGLYFESVRALAIPSSLTLLGLVFFLAGMAFKISLVPFHLWTADVYQGAPTNITAFLSVVSKSAAAFALMLVLFKVFPALFDYWEYVVYALIVASITIGNLFAMRQKNMKRFLAYSSISQAGYLLLGMLAGTAFGMTSAVYYVLVYTVANLGIFAIVSEIENRTGKTEISDYNGLYKTNPYLSVGMMLFLFSLAGIPPFAGFFSKFFVFAAAVEKEYYGLVFIALINTVLSLYYYLLVVKAMFIGNDKITAIARLKTNGYTKTALFIALAGTLLLGLLSCIFAYIEDFSFGLM